jgi:hypothetical protein
MKEQVNEFREALARTRPRMRSARSRGTWSLRNGSSVSWSIYRTSRNQRPAGFGTAETVCKQRRAKQQVTRSSQPNGRYRNEHRAAFVRAQSERQQQTMDKGNRLLLHSSPERISANNAFGIASFNSHLDVQDKRVVQLLVLLQQLNTSAGGLGALPETELGEVIASAVRLCGFLNPIEARDVIATVLEGLKMQDPIPEHP